MRNRAGRIAFVFSATFGDSRDAIRLGSANILCRQASRGVGVPSNRESRVSISATWRSLQEPGVSCCRG
jgi:hypothetical protein